MKLYRLNYNTIINLDMIIEIDREGRRIFMLDGFEYKLGEVQFESLLEIINKYCL